MSPLTAPHIWLSDSGVAWVDKTNTKVTEIALDVVAHGWSTKTIQLNHPHLSLAQIHAALTYYYDHKSHLDQQIEEDLRAIEDSSNPPQNLHCKNRPPQREKLGERIALHALK